MQFASYAEKEPGRFKRGRGWKVNLLGKNSDVPKVDLQAFRIDMSSEMVLQSHMHIVDQFQVFIAGSGTIGRDNADMVTVHYADHHTGYGPLVAGLQGMSYLTLRPKTDAGMLHLSLPDIRSHLRPTKRRHRVSTKVVLSIPPVMAHLEAPVIETIMEEKPGDDGMTSTVIRLGAGMSLPAPATNGTGGYYVVVMNGSLEFEDDSLDPWSVIFVSHEDTAPLLQAGEGGVELLLTVFPIQDEWMQNLGVE